MSEGLKPKHPDKDNLTAEEWLVKLKRDRKYNKKGEVQKGLEEY